MTAHKQTILGESATSAQVMYADGRCVRCGVLEKRHRKSKKACHAYLQ